MTFEHYMAMCLYHPEFGYYMQGRQRTGRAGDYFTSSDLHPVFARLLARQAAEIWEVLGRPALFTWVEMGAGRGLFAWDFLTWTKRALPEFAARLRYIAIEPGPKQRAHLSERLGGVSLDRGVQIAANVDELEPAAGCFFSNELVDAFPVSVVTRRDGHLKEIYVAAEGDELREKLGPISDPAVAAFVARYAKLLEEGQRVEVSQSALRWLRTVAEKLAKGFLITIDYGDLAEYLYTEDRPRGTLLAYRGHTTSEDYFSTPGENDLTAHVNFRSLIDAGKELGLELAGFTTQEKFLLALGEADEFADLYDPGQTELEKLQARLKLKRLISPVGMGTIFKVLVQQRDVAAPQLTGLKYKETVKGEG
jgi:SAM-dependent MidA family methyltransferase